MKLINEVFIGSLTEKTEKERKETLEKFREDNRKDKIKVAISPKFVTKEFLKLLKGYNVSTVELEVQSTNDYILKKCNFTYNLEDIKKATKLIKWNRFKVSFQVGVGLPESNKIDELNTAKDLARLRPNVVRIYPMVVVKNTWLEKEFEDGKYEPLNLNQAIERCKEVVYAFNRKRIKQINIVKQNELNKSEETEIVSRTLSRSLCTIGH